jgi:hypothetical protein
MKRGIGAIPHNLIIKSGGYTYYPLNQFEIDGTVAVELYRQDSDGDKTKVFVFKGTKNELSEFKKRYPVKAKKKYFYRQKRYPYDNLELNDPEILKLKPAEIKRLYNKVDVDMDQNKPLFALAENLSAEAANFNKKIKTGARLTPNEQIAVKKSGTTMINVLRKLDENKIIDQKYPKSNAFTRRKPIAVKKAKSPAVKKVAVKKPVAKKAAVKKTTTKKSPLRQTGSSNKKYDERVSAMKPGKRKSASGNIYYERRADRSDKGKNL